MVLLYDIIIVDILLLSHFKIVLHVITKHPKVFFIHLIKPLHLLCGDLSKLEFFLIPPVMFVFPWDAQLGLGNVRGEVVVDTALLQDVVKLERMLQSISKLI